ncbi:hypothetical protein ACRALDRAFT_206680 [Sodiomyces alcalophilus JCM 7366]|uniref:uncharacterized protein n=1 Tax=Sodiomyces alcalophilus JCM 7366 TaxID=591952 RepID=UPI0039B6CE5B
MIYCGDSGGVKSAKLRPSDADDTRDPSANAAEWPTTDRAEVMYRTEHRCLLAMDILNTNSVRVTLAVAFQCHMPFPRRDSGSAGSTFIPNGIRCRYLANGQHSNIAFSYGLIEPTLPHMFSAPRPNFSNPPNLSGSSVQPSFTPRISTRRRNCQLQVRLSHDRGSGLPTQYLQHMQENNSRDPDAVFFQPYLMFHDLDILDILDLAMPDSKPWVPSYFVVIHAGLSAIVGARTQHASPSRGNAVLEHAPRLLQSRTF